MNSRDARTRRHARIRRRLSGVPERPRLCVFRSDRHIYAQIIDDSTNRVLVSASTLSKEFKEKGLKGSDIAGAKLVGELVAQKAVEKSISKVVFDRSGFIYHGRIRALAEAAREKGLQF